MDNNERLSTGIKSLDNLLTGGLLKFSNTLVAGPPGSGKTTLGLSFIVDGLRRGEPGLIITFEEFPEMYYRDAKNFGWDLKAYEKEGILKIIFTSPEILLLEMEKEMGLFDETGYNNLNQRVLIDPVTYFHYLEDKTKNLRDIYNSIINSLRRTNCTSIFTCELKQSLGNLRYIGKRMPFIVDNIIILTYFESNSSIQRAINIIKTRGSNHQKRILNYKITDKGIKIGSSIKNKEGIMTGTPRTILNKIFKKR